MEKSKCNNNGCNCTKEERASNNGNCKHCVVVNVPEKIRVVAGKKDNWGETLEAKDEFEPTVKERETIKAAINDLKEAIDKEEKIERIIDELYKRHYVKYGSDLPCSLLNDEQWLRDMLRSL